MASQTIKNESQTIKNTQFQNNHTIHKSAISSDTLKNIRILSLLYLSAIYIWLIATSKTMLTDIIYLTQLGYFLVWLYFLLTVQHRCMRNCFTDLQADRLAGLVQKIYYLGFSLQLPITLVFWVVLFRLLLQKPGITTQLIILNANLHAGPIICLIIDLLYNTYKFPHYNIRNITVVAITYLSINCIYSVSVHPVYPPIDWISIKSYILCIISLALAYIMHIMGAFIFIKCKRHRLQSDRHTLAQQNQKQTVME